MHYKINPLSKDALRQLAQARLVTPSPKSAEGLNTQDVQRLLEDLEISRIELEMQNEHMQETYARLMLAHRRATELYDLAPVAYFCANAQGFITNANLTGSAMLGLERSHLMQQSFETFFLEGQRTKIRSLMALAIESGESQRDELTLLAEHAPCRFVQIDMNALAQRSECQIVLTDLTSRANLENQSKEEADQLKFALEAAGDCVWDWNLLSGTVRYSPQIEQLYGYAFHELGESIDIWRALVHPDDQSTFIKGVQQCLSGQDTRLACEVRVRCKDGKHKWILCRGAICNRTLDGRVDRLVGTYTDISAYLGKAT